MIAICSIWMIFRLCHSIRINVFRFENKYYCCFGVNLTVFDLILLHLLLWLLLLSVKFICTLPVVRGSICFADNLFYFIYFYSFFFLIKIFGCLPVNKSVLFSMIKILLFAITDWVCSFYYLLCTSLFNSVWVEWSNIRLY